MSEERERSKRGLYLRTALNNPQHEDENNIKIRQIL